jgi:hypothetical protein
VGTLIPVFPYGMVVTIVITTKVAIFIFGAERSIPNTTEKNLTLSTSAISYIKIVQGFTNVEGVTLRSKIAR